jgi:hypothetical protein
MLREVQIQSKFYDISKKYFWSFYKKLVHDVKYTSVEDVWRLFVTRNDVNILWVGIFFIDDHVYSTRTRFSDVIEFLFYKKSPFRLFWNIVTIIPMFLRRGYEGSGLHVQGFEHVTVATKAFISSPDSPDRLWSPSSHVFNENGGHFGRRRRAGMRNSPLTSL